MVIMFVFMHFDRIYIQREHAQCWQMHTSNHLIEQLTVGWPMWMLELNFTRIGIQITKGDETLISYFGFGFVNPAMISYLTSVRWIAIAMAGHWFQADSAMTSLWPTRPWLTGTNNTAINKCLKPWDHSNYTCRLSRRQRYRIKAHMWPM